MDALVEMMRATSCLLAILVKCSTLRALHSELQFEYQKVIWEPSDNQ